MSHTLLAEPKAQEILDRLETDGAVAVPNLIPPDVLRSMQTAFGSRLKHLRWNDFDGYEQTEPFRHMVQDVLTLDQGFVDLALHPVVKSVLREYLGDHFALCEAKGWLSLPTSKDFHGWHGDAWYDQSKITDHVPREVKVAFYLTDVKSGAFTYVKGTQGKEAPRGYRTDKVAAEHPADRIVEFLAPAGTAVIFDTSGVHRQNMPILEPRRAVFLNYHDPRIPLQAEDVEYNRYHPLILNAAFLGDLDAEDMKILGFGDKTNFVPAFERKPKHRTFHRSLTSAYVAKMRAGRFASRATGKLRKILGLKK